MAAFSNTLARLMKERGLTQAQLADATGISQAAISRYLKGRTPKTSELIKIARHFGVAGDYLIYGATGVVDSESVEFVADWAKRAAVEAEKTGEVGFDMLAEAIRHSITELKSENRQTAKDLNALEEMVNGLIEKASAKGFTNGRNKKLPDR